MPEAEREKGSETDENEPGRERGDERTSDEVEGLLTLICLTCGNEKFFADAVPERVTCEKCGGITFRNFFTPTEPDEATLSHLEETSRSIALDEESPDISPDELRELNNP